MLTAHSLPVSALRPLPPLVVAALLALILSPPVRAEEGVTPAPLETVQEEKTAETTMEPGQAQGEKTALPKGAEGESGEAGKMAVEQTAEQGQRAEHTAQAERETSAQPGQNAQTASEEPTPSSPEKPPVLKAGGKQQVAKNSKKAKKEEAKKVLEVRVEGKLNEAERTNIRNFLSFSKLDPTVTPSRGMFTYYLGKAEKEAAQALEPFGYYNPTIEISGEYAEDKASVLVRAETGKATLIRSLDLNYAGAGAEETPLLKAKERFAALKGQVFNHSVYEQNKSTLLDLATELGYPRAHYSTSRVEVRRLENTADIHMLLDTDLLYTVGKLHFASDILDEDLLQRMSPVHDGDPLAPHALTDLRQSLYDSGYFSNVGVSYNLDEAEEGITPVTVQTQPAPRHRYGLGLGYGTDTGGRATLEYSNRYLNRRGHQLDVRLRPSERLSSFSGQYSIPVGDPQVDKLYLSTNYQTESFENIDATTWLTKVSREHNWENGQIAAYVQYLDEDFDTGDRGGHASLFIPGLSASWLWADDRVNTKHGLKLWASVEGSEEGIFATTSFVQVKAGGKLILTPWHNWRVIGRGQLGFSMMDALDDLPPSLRFFAGGDQSVRGYGYKMISPRDEEKDIIGGKHLLFYSAELERVLSHGVALAAFFDSAAVTNDLDRYTMISGTGVGLHWNAPFGQLRIDLAVPVEDIQWKTVRLHFTLGTDL